MKKVVLIMAPAILLFSCQEKTGEKKLEVNGTITNNPAKMIYLEEIPMTTSQRIVVDSAELGKDGKFKLSTTTGEARVYQIQLGPNSYPLAVLVNDAKKITVDVKFSKENSQFPESYEVKGSVTSQQVKDFMAAFNNKFQLIMADARRYDSLYQTGARDGDSSLQAIRTNVMGIAEAIKATTLEALKKSNNAAFSMFILGYYQSTANMQGSGLTGLSNDEVAQIVNDAAAKFPGHQGLIAIKSTLSATAAGWVGQPAPEIALPDPNGKEVKLSSFRGKYVLVDFWASWCRPCREENPNVVNAYNKYKDKNFTILGVSLDQPGGRDAWMKAVMKDKLTWTHVSDLKFWSSEVVPLYRIEGIPYNVLVDPEGKIIAERLYGAELDKKLETLLQ